MPRASKISLLPKDQKEKLKEIIRAHQYCQLDLARTAALESGIVLSRSVLHRFVQSLYKAESGALAANMVVMIVSRETGQIHALACDASASDIEAAIRSLDRTETDSKGR